MLAEVSISTVIAIFLPATFAEGLASAITSAAKTAHFRTRHARDAPESLRIQIQRTGSKRSSGRNNGRSNVISLCGETDRSSHPRHPRAAPYLRLVRYVSPRLPVLFPPCEFPSRNKIATTPSTVGSRPRAPAIAKGLALR